MAYQPYPTYKTTADNNMGQNAKYTGWGTGGGSTGGITSGQSGTPTYGGSDAWNNTNKQAASPWGGTSSNTTYGTNPVRTSNQGNAEMQPTYSTNPAQSPFRNTLNTTSNPAPPVGTPMGQQPGTPTPGSGMAPGYGIGNDYWNPGNSGSQAQGAEPFLGYGFDWKTATPEQLAAFTQMQPWEQMKQNSYQYGQDFNENQRRWNEQFGWTQGNDMFNQNLASQQQASAQQIAEWQQQNWGQQYALDTELGRAAADLGQRNATIQDWYNQKNAYANQYNVESTRAYQQGQIANDATQNSNQDWYNRAQMQLGNLTQEQLTAYRNAQLAQENELTRAGYANQITQANINAFGRAQTPRSRWIRSW